MQILNSIWFHNTNNVPVVFVLTENEKGEQCVKIGSAVFGDKENEHKFIAKYGAPLTFRQANGFFPKIDKSKYKK